MRRMDYVLVMLSVIMSLTGMPAIAADYTLDIFGNANMDDTIDELDIEYIEGIIEGTNDGTELADANYDGRIDEDDIAQIELIIHGEDKELTLIDSADRIVTVKKPVTKVVELVSTSLEVMRSLNVETDKIVGVDSWGTKQESVFFPEFTEFPNCGQLSPYAVDFEKILELDPDVVILYGEGIPEACENAQNELNDLNPNIVILRFDCWEPETYLEEVQTLGYIFDKKEEADEFCAFVNGILNTITETVGEIPEDEKIRVYYEHTNPYQVSWGGGGGYNRRLEMAGANLIFGDLSTLGPVYVDPEEVAARDPEIIVKLAVSGCGYDTDNLTELIRIRDEILNRPELADVTAIKNNRVYVISSKIVPKSFFVGMAYTAKWFYPELFEDLDPKAVHQEYLTRFQGLDYDLDKHGVFVYPPLEVS